MIYSNFKVVAPTDFEKNSGQNGFIFSNYKVAKSVVNVGKYLPTVHLAAKSMVNVRKYTIN